jgi:hypothetical protein
MWCQKLWIDMNKMCDNNDDPPSNAGFQSMGVPPNQPIFMGFSIRNHPAIGDPPFVETPKCSGTLLSNTPKHGLRESVQRAANPSPYLQATSKHVTEKNLWI